jgi:transposase
MPQLTLSEKQAEKLRAEMTRGKSSNVYRRAAALLAAHQGFPISNIASLLGVTRQTIYNWIATYSPEGNRLDLNDAPRSGRPSFWTKEIDDLMIHALASSPPSLGCPASQWNAATLRRHLEMALGRAVCDETLRRRLRRLGYYWRNGRYAKTSGSGPNQFQPVVPRPEVETPAGCQNNYVDVALA